MQICSSRDSFVQICQCFSVSYVEDRTWRLSQRYYMNEEIANLTNGVDRFSVWKYSKAVLKYSSAIKKNRGKGEYLLNFALNCSESRPSRITDLSKNVIFTKRENWNKWRPTKLNT